MRAAAGKMMFVIAVVPIWMNLPDMVRDFGPVVGFGTAALVSMFFYPFFKS